MIGDTVITSSLTGSILPGVTRDSTIRLLKKWGYKVDERRLTIDELFAAAEDGSLKEAWATGTACVISPIGTLVYKGKEYVINGDEVGELSQRLYDTLYGMQIGTREDEMGDWVVTI
jgi:branched-chain amino acid aminotransferase